MRGFSSYFTCAALTDCKGELSLLLNLLRRGVCHHHCCALIFVSASSDLHSHSFNRLQIWDRMSYLLWYTVIYSEIYYIWLKNVLRSVSYQQYLERLNQAYPIFELICWINLFIQCGTLWKEVNAGRLTGWQCRLDALPDTCLMIKAWHRNHASSFFLKDSQFVWQA